MCPGRGIDELSRDAHSVCPLANAAFQHVAHPKLAPDLLHVDGAALVCEARAAGDDEQRLETRQRRDDVIYHAVGEIFLFRIGAQVGEGENGDRGFIGERKSGFWHFFQIAGDCRACRSLRFPHLSNETKALARQGLDEALLIPGIADCTPGDIQARRQCRIGHATPVPDGFNKIVFADHKLPVPDQVVE
jgi:hypothetical protein